jgi:hypothetical protein
MTYEDYRNLIKKDIKLLMKSDPVVKLKLKSLNNNRDEEIVNQFVLDGFMLDTPHREIVQKIADKAGVSQYLFEAYLKG